MGADSDNSQQGHADAVSQQLRVFIKYRDELLPKSLQALAKIEVAQVRQKLFDEDVAHLISRLEAIAREQPGPSRKAVAPPRPADLGDYVALLQERLIARSHERRVMSAET